jgi:uncharacterized delta-60 repeat protein
MYPISKNILATAITLACTSPAFSAPAPILGLDSSFSADGSHVQNYGITTGTTASHFSDVAVTPDDKIIAVGHAKRNSSQFEGIIVKYLSDGSLDTSFDTDGIARHHTLSDTILQDVVIQADGKILVAGRSRAHSDWQLVVMRLNTDGALDTSFADNGIYTTRYTNPASAPSVRPSHGNLIPSDIGLNSKGEIFISANQFTGATQGNNRYVGHVIKLNSRGVLDTGFGYVDTTANNGKTTIAHGSNEAYNNYSTEITKLTFDANDRMYVGGQWSYMDTANPKTMFLTRLEADGKYYNQTSQFSSIYNRWSGHAAVQSSSNTAKQVLNSAVVLPSGDVISAGCDVATSATEVRIQKQNGTIGGLDANFGSNGIASFGYSSSTTDCISDLSYHPRAGLLTVGNSDTFPIITVVNNDTGIEIEAKEMTMAGEFSAVATLSTGKIVAVGTSAAQSLIAVFQGKALFSGALPTVSIPSFASKTNVALDVVSSSTNEGVTLTPSNPLNAKVIDGSAEVNLVPSGPALLLSDGDNIKLTHTSNSKPETETITKLVIDRYAGFSHNNKSWKPTDSISTFKTTTLEADTTPDAFSFAAQTDVALSTATSSAAVSIAGINAATTIAVKGGEYSINSSSFTSMAGTLVNGDTVTVRHTSSASVNTDTYSTLVIGGVSATFTSNTAASTAVTPPSDTTPDVYSFASKTSVALSAVISSGSVTIAGIDTATIISVTNGEYSLNGGSFTTATGTLTNGTVVTVRHTSPAQYSANTTTQLNIGGVTSNFKTTTIVANTTGDASSDGGSGGGSMNFLYLLAAGLFFGRKRK